MNCVECGKNLTAGICADCHKELYIVEFQNDKITFPVGTEFLKKVSEQLEKTKEGRHAYWSSQNNNLEPA